MQSHSALLGAHQDSLSYPGHRNSLPRSLAVIVGNVHSLKPRQRQITEPYHYFGAILDLDCDQCLNQCGEMIDESFLSLEGVAEEVAATPHEDVLPLHKQPTRVLKLQAEELVIGDQVEADKLVPAQQQHLSAGEGTERQDVFADGEGRALGLGMCHELVGGRLVEDGGVGDVDDGGQFGLLRQPVRPAILQHIIIGRGGQKDPLQIDDRMIVNPESYEDDLEDGIVVYVLACLTLHQLVLPVLILVLDHEPLSLLDIGTDQLDLLLLLGGEADDGTGAHVDLVADYGEVLLSVETEELQVQLLYLKDFVEEDRRDLSAGHLRLHLCSLLENTVLFVIFEDALDDHAMELPAVLLKLPIEPRPQVEGEDVHDCQAHRNRELVCLFSQLFDEFLSGYFLAVLVVSQAVLDLLDVEVAEEGVDGACVETVSGTTNHTAQEEGENPHQSIIIISGTRQGRARLQGNNIRECHMGACLYAWLIRESKDSGLLFALAMPSR